MNTGDIMRIKGTMIAMHMMNIMNSQSQMTNGNVLSGSQTGFDWTSTTTRGL